MPQLGQSTTRRSNLPWPYCSTLLPPKSSLCKQSLQSLKWPADILSPSKPLSVDTNIPCILLPFPTVKAQNFHALLYFRTGSRSFRFLTHYCEETPNSPGLLFIQSVEAQMPLDSFLKKKKEILKCCGAVIDKLLGHWQTLEVMKQRLASLVLHLLTLTWWWHATVTLRTK